MINYELNELPVFQIFIQTMMLKFLFFLLILNNYKQYIQGKSKPGFCTFFYTILPDQLAVFFKGDDNFFTIQYLYFWQLTILISIFYKMWNTWNTGSVMFSSCLIMNFAKSIMSLQIDFFNSNSVFCLRIYFICTVKRIIHM